MTRSVLARLLALLVITVAGVYYITFDAIGVKWFNEPYTVHVDLPAAGGVYSAAYVTYRGVEVGRVTALHLHRGYVEADLAIDHGTRIPSDVTASVRELTAAAEQYMDLVPRRSGGPFLGNGSTIPEDHTTIPTSVGTLLNTVNSLVDSLNPQDLNTLTSALATGLQNTGADLHSIIVNADTLVSALQSAIPGTNELIDAGDSVLSTFNATSSEFAGFSANLDAISAQLDRANSGLVALLHNGTAAGQALQPYLSRTSASTQALIDQLASSTNVAYQRQPAIQALFQVLPLFSQDVALTTANGQIHFELTFNTRDPVCPYTSTMVEPTVLMTLPSLTNSCGVQSPGLLQRGADKAPPPEPQG